MSGLTKEFNEWWDSDELLDDNPYELESALFWAWEGWQAGVKREREACAVIAFNAKTYLEAAAAIRARGNDAA